MMKIHEEDVQSTKTGFGNPEARSKMTRTPLSPLSRNTENIRSSSCKTPNNTPAKVQNAITQPSKETTRSSTNVNTYKMCSQIGEAVTSKFEGSSYFHRGAFVAVILGLFGITMVLQYSPSADSPKISVPESHFTELQQDVESTSLTTFEIDLPLGYLRPHSHVISEADKSQITDSDETDSNDLYYQTTNMVTSDYATPNVNAVDDTSDQLPTYVIRNADDDSDNATVAESSDAALPIPANFQNLAADEGFVNVVIDAAQERAAAVPVQDVENEVLSVEEDAISLLLTPQDILLAPQDIMLAPQDILLAPQAILLAPREDIAQAPQDTEDQASTLEDPVSLDEESNDAMSLAEGHENQEREESTSHQSGDRDNEIVHNSPPHNSVVPPPAATSAPPNPIILTDSDSEAAADGEEEGDPWSNGEEEGDPWSNPWSNGEEEGDPWSNPWSNDAPSSSSSHPWEASIISGPIQISLNTDHAYILAAHGGNWSAWGEDWGEEIGSDAAAGGRRGNEDGRGSSNVAVFARLSPSGSLYLFEQAHDEYPVSIVSLDNCRISESDNLNGRRIYHITRGGCFVVHGADHETHEVCAGDVDEAADWLFAIRDLPCVP